MSLRVVFQGGGARLGALLAAADSLNRVCERSDIQLSQISGVSAGSIAGAALASGIPIETFRHRLASEAEVFVREFEAQFSVLQFLVDHEMIRLLGRVQEAQLSGKGIGFGLANDIRAAMKARTPSLVKALNFKDGHPVVRFEILENALRRIFNEAGRDLTFADLKHPLAVFSSDLSNGSQKNYDKTSTPDTPLYKALASSCAMPGIFRGFAGGNAEFDGGLAGNLPFSFFPYPDDRDVRTLCFTFPGKGARITNVLEFGMALLNCAMNSAVREAVLQATESGGFVFELADDVDTFEWRKVMLTQLKPADFSKLSNGLDDRVRDSVNRLFANGGYKLVRKSRFGSDDVAQVFDKIYRSFPVKKLRSVRVYISGKTRRKKIADPLLDDERYFVDTIQPSGDTMVACQVSLSYNLKKMGTLTVEVRDKDGEDVPFEAYLHRSEDGVGGTRHRVLVFFDRPVPKTRGKLTVSVREEGDVVWLQNRPWDFFMTRAVLADEVDETIWLGTCKKENSHMYVPEELSSIDEDTKKAIAEEVGRPVEFKNWVKGAVINNSEAQRLIKALCKDTLTADFNCWGWKAGPIGNQMGAGVLVRRKDEAPHA